MNNHLSHGCDCVAFAGANPKFGSLVDLPINEQHHTKREVKCPEGGEDRVGRLLAHLALHPLWVGLPPAEERRQGDDGGQQPCERNHHIGNLFASLQCILQVPGDGPVAVQCDGRHIPDAGCAAEYVKGDPHLAQHATQFPQPAIQLMDETERHDQGSHHHVGDGHWSHKVVGDSVERLHPEDGRQHQQVPDKGGYHQHRQ